MRRTSTSSWTSWLQRRRRRRRRRRVSDDKVRVAGFPRRPVCRSLFHPNITLIQENQRAAHEVSELRRCLGLLPIRLDIKKQFPTAFRSNYFVTFAASSFVS